jgi:hypothetical protein
MTTIQPVFNLYSAGTKKNGAIMTSRYLIAIAWVGYLAIVIASLVPGSARSHIHGFPGELEHFLA